MEDILASAENARKKNRFNEAKQLYEKALETEPENITALEGLILCLYSLGDIKGAYNICNKAINIDAALLIPHIYLAYIYDDFGDVTESKKEAKTVLNLSPDSADALCCYGVILVLNKEYEEAVEYLERSIEIDPNMYLAHYNLFASYSAIKDFNRAYVQAKALFRLKPNLRNIYLLIVSYLSANVTVRFLIFVVPIVLYILHFKIFLIIHALLMFIFLISAFYNYKNSDSQRFKLNIIMILVFIVVDVLLITNYP